MAGRFSLQYNVPADVILLAWIIKHPAGILPFCGTADPSRIANLIKATTIDMELQDWFALWLESAGVQFLNFLDIACLVVFLPASR